MTFDPDPRFFSGDLFLDYVFVWGELPSKSGTFFPLATGLGEERVPLLKFTPP